MRILGIFFLLGILMITSCAEESQPGAENEVVERVRPAAQGGTTAAYFMHENTSSKSDTLVFIRAEIAEITQVHETYETEDGMMGMREQEQVVVSSGENIEFRQGGLHVMLISLKNELVDGDSVTIDMKWSNAGLVQKKLPVQP